MPWIIPTMGSIAKAAKKLGYQCSGYDLLSERLDEHAIFKVRADEKAVPIGIGMTDVDEVTKHLLGVVVNFREQQSTENTIMYSYKSKSEIAGTVEIVPINVDNVDDEIDLCVGEGFLYGAMPQKFLKEAIEMKRKWLKYLLSKFNVCGYIAYLEKRPVGVH